MKQIAPNLFFSDQLSNIQLPLNNIYRSFKWIITMSISTPHTMKENLHFKQGAPMRKKFSNLNTNNIGVDKAIITIIQKEGVKYRLINDTILPKRDLHMNVKKLKVVSNYMATTCYHNKKPMVYIH